MQEQLATRVQVSLLQHIDDEPSVEELGDVTTALHQHLQSLLQLGHKGDGASAG